MTATRERRRSFSSYHDPIKTFTKRMVWDASKGTSSTTSSLTAHALPLAPTPAVSAALQPPPTPDCDFMPSRPWLPLRQDACSPLRQDASSSGSGLTETGEFAAGAAGAATRTRPLQAAGPPENKNRLCHLSVACIVTSLIGCPPPTNQLRIEQATGGGMGGRGSNGSERAI